MDYYSVLGIKPGASVDEIKRAYRQLVFRFHPDRNPDDPDAADKFSQVRDAYAVLSDALKRRVYDSVNHPEGVAEEEVREEPAEENRREEKAESGFTGNPFGAGNGANAGQSYQQRIDPEPKCPSCSVVGIDHIVSRKGGSGSARGKHFILAPFSVVMCRGCGHVYGITGNSN